MKNREKIIALLIVIIMVSVIFSSQELSSKNQKTTSFDCATKLIVDMGKEYPGKFTPAEYKNVYNCTLHAFSSTGSKEEYLNTTLNFTYVYFCQNGLYTFCSRISINYSYNAPIYLYFSSYNLDRISNPMAFKIPSKSNNSVIFLEHSIDSIFASDGKVHVNGSYKKGMNLNFISCAFSNYTKIAETANYEIQIYLTQNLYTTYYISMKEVYANNNHEVFYHDP